jgi:peroxiredoxin
MPAVGDTAPDFTLKDQNGNDVTLSALRGKPVVIVFYPFTFTGVCQGELCEIRDDPSAFERGGAQVLAISCDSRHSQRIWAEEQGFTFPVLSDFWPHGEVAKASSTRRSAAPTAPPSCSTRTAWSARRSRHPTSAPLGRRPSTRMRWPRSADRSPTKR